MRKYLILQTGEIFEGVAAGAPGEAVAELVFTTAMTGYNETLTDPSYFGQLVMQTFPLIGNYGAITADAESRQTALSGYVVSSLCNTPSNFRCEGELDGFLKTRGVPAIMGVDTRQLTRIIREHGTMNAKLSDTPSADLDEIRAYRVKDAVASVSAKVKETAEPENTLCSVALLDYGEKRSIVKRLTARGCRVTVLPYDTPAEELLSGGYDGVMLSNGPGDPKENVYSIEQIRKIYGSLPIFGICLGHQLLALALGGDTEKLKYGHRGANQPCKNADGRTYITSQNHGYAVVAASLPSFARVSFTNANDGTVEGVEYDGGAFSVQFHPEASGGPRDTEFLFDKFVTLMKGNENA